MLPACSFQIVFLDHIALKHTKTGLAGGVCNAFNIHSDPEIFSR
jgi:hypothetical protein